MDVTGRLQRVAKGLQRRFQGSERRQEVQQPERLRRVPKLGYDAGIAVSRRRGQRKYVGVV